MRRFTGMLLIALLAPAAVLMAQDEPRAASVAAQENPITSDSKHTFSGVRRILLRAAEVMPEENYNYKPTEVVRTYGQIVGHVADSQYIFCSRVLGEKSPAPGIEKTKSSKADLIAALTEAFDYCDRAYASITDATGVEQVKLMGGKPKLGVLNVNSIHTIEHYGNLVTYLRMKNIVPPTSDPDFMKQLN